MNTRIFNRDFEHPTDGWYNIEASGEHPNAGAGVIQVIDKKACEQIANRFNADATAGRLSHGHEMLIDHEHFKHDINKETIAYGWLTQLQNRSDGLYGQIRWTGTGKQAVDNGDYRFFSTEYDPDDLEVLNDAKPCLVRPVRLDGLTLTNEPNNKGQKPITNRRSGRDLPRTRTESIGKTDARGIMNRAKQLRKEMPRLTLATATIMAQREFENGIVNRAIELKNRAPKLSAATATVIVQKDPDGIMYRAIELRRQMPRLSLATATIMAQKEIQQLPPK